MITKGARSEGQKGNDTMLCRLRRIPFPIRHARLYSQGAIVCNIQRAFMGVIIRQSALRDFLSHLGDGLWREGWYFDRVGWSSLLLGSLSR